ncbi:MAG: hypothetical protein IJ197_05315 [Bacteroidaceae bacterium]|nr:hypothetical protein [Bacteroidaceae bacterium]
MSELISVYLFYSLAVVALIVIVGGGIYLILRPLVLWYFKIYSIETELKENNALLRGILEELSENNSQIPSSHQLKGDYSKYMPR